MMSGKIGLPIEAAVYGKRGVDAWELCRQQVKIRLHRWRKSTVTVIARDYGDQAFGLI